ncbi:MAG: hypothetical protein AAF921_05795 [Cyanobacteria bacterium P01_D01_bin.44]
MAYLTRLGLVLLVSPAISLISQESLAQDFDLILRGSANTTRVEQGVEYSLIIAETPHPEIDYRLVQILPNPRFDYKLIIIEPPLGQTPPLGQSERFR